MDREDGFEADRLGAVRLDATQRMPAVNEGRFAAHGDAVAGSDGRKRVAILFSGGDAPGMNPLLRFFVRLGLNRYKAKVLGVKDGYVGLVRTSDRVLQGELSFRLLLQRMECDIGIAGIFRGGLDIVDMDHVSVSGLASRGGIVLGAARCPEFHDAEVRQQVYDLLVDLDVDSLVAVGGNGSLEGTRRFAAETDIHVVGIPATIDDDVVFSETALGFDTAVNNAMRAIEQINDTGGSHHRIMVVQTMGRDCGNLARTAALAGGVEIVVTPERGLLTGAKMEAIAQRLERCFVRGQSHAVVVVAEGVITSEQDSSSPAAALSRFLERYFERPCCPVHGIGVRENVLGHMQRGGNPTAADRTLAARFAESAWEEIMNARPRSGMLGVRCGHVEFQPFEEAVPNPCVGTLQESVYALQKSVSKWG